MKLLASLALILMSCLTVRAEKIKVNVDFPEPVIVALEKYHVVQAEGLLLSARHGEPVLPYKTINILLPPGDEAVDLYIEFEGYHELPGSFILIPGQYSSPISAGISGVFSLNEAVYKRQTPFPDAPTGKLITGFLYGHSIAMTTITPAVYAPVTGTIGWYKSAIITVTTRSSAKKASILQNLSGRASSQKIISDMVLNASMLARYPVKSCKSVTDLLIITPESYKNAFNTLRNYYFGLGITSDIISPAEIETLSTGIDVQDKIRNYIISRYQQDDIVFVLLGGDVELVPYRGFYCMVVSSIIYEENNIPSDLYYASLDGTWNDNGNNRWGEPGEDDLLPELAVARLPFSNATEQSNMLNKIYMYQSSPIIAELEKTLLAGEKLYDNPLTWGGDYLDLLIGYQNANGYITQGIPPSPFIEKMYERDMGVWTASQLKAKLNSGFTLVHHSGHSNYNYVMKLYSSDITIGNFGQVNGTTHNFNIVYSHGCICGAFDYSDCIGENMLKLPVLSSAVLFNSRYGWFNEGQTEGPSAHLHREFVHSLYTLGYNRIGQTQQHSKIRTAPWVTAPGQWEEGALRWCFYGHNILGDPAMKIYTGEITGIDGPLSHVQNPRIFPNPASSRAFIELQEPKSDIQRIVIYDLTGRQIAIVSGLEVNGYGRIDLSTSLGRLSSGQYIVLIHTNKVTYHCKLTVAKDF